MARSLPAAILSTDRAISFPTIVRDIDDSARLVTEEQFAPILPILKYVDLDDVIARANFGTFGLAASVWGKDLDAAYGIAQKLDAGTVWVNKHFDLPPDVPSGAKQSGLGAELGREGMAEYSQPKIINMATSRVGFLVDGRRRIGCAIAPKRL
nr:aldehyde dehydrogenase family protein [Caballeronia sp. CLC5]